MPCHPLGSAVREVRQHSSGQAAVPGAVMAEHLDALFFGINDQAHVGERVHHRLHRAQLLAVFGRPLADESRVRFKRCQHVGRAG